MRALRCCIYAGDFDPSGEDIERDFLVRAACFAETVRVALDWDQVEEFDLPPQEGKPATLGLGPSLPDTAGSYRWS